MPIVTKTLSRTMEITFNVSEDVEIDAVVAFDAWPRVEDTRDVPGEPAGCYITNIDVRAVRVAIPGIDDDIGIGESLVSKHYKAIARWTLMQGDILEALQVRIVEELANESAD